MKIKLWGVRGSIPSSPSPKEWQAHIQKILFKASEFEKQEKGSVQDFITSSQSFDFGGYGTATTCIEVSSGDHRIVIDGGSGIRSLSEKIMGGGKALEQPHHIFMTHFHWDHVIGLPFFAPHFVPDAQIHYYAVQEDLEELIRGVFRKPYFPVPFENLPSKIHFHLLEPRKPFALNGFVITPYRLDHPDPCWGYRIEADGKTYAHCVDTEATRLSPADLGEDLPLYQNVDLMYFDAQYTLPELAEKASWGHSASEVGLELAFREKVKRILFAHHDPGAHFEQIESLKKQTRDFYELILRKQSSSKFETRWEFAVEGMEIPV